MRTLTVASPAFAVDRLETLEEIAITGHEQFMGAGGERYAYIPCLNDSEGGMVMLEQMVRRELSGWL